jgi:hypothetical protein
MDKIQKPSNSEYNKCSAKKTMHCCFIIIIIIIIIDADVCKAIKRLKPSKSVGLDIPGFVIKGFSFIFIHVLKHTFNLSLTQQNFLAVRKEVAIPPVFIRGNHAAVSNISILKSCSF